jgi:DNA-binding MarR family transcriptional regulator
MGRTRLPIADDQPTPIADRIVSGLHKIGLAMKQQTWLLANEEGLSATQGQILAALVAHGPSTGTELSQRLGVTLPTISESVRALVDKALVTRAPDPRHPRASVLTPTKRGAGVGERARSWPEFLAGAVADLSPDEQRVFFGGVVKMVRALQDQGLVPLSGMCVTCTHFRPHVRKGASPHHCALVDAPLAGDELRLDCPDHDLAPDARRRALWEQFVAG